MSIRRIRHQDDRLKVAIADDSSLIYSDDYRRGWIKGFRGIGVEAKVFDIAMLRRHIRSAVSPYSSGSARGHPKMLAENIARWGAHLMFAHHGLAAHHGGFLSTLKRNGVKTAVYLCDEPYEVGWTAGWSPHFDYVFSLDPCTMHVHQASRKDREPRVFYLPAATDLEEFKPIPESQRDISALFLGNAALPPRPRWLGPVEDSVDGVRVHYYPRKEGGVVGKGHAKWISLDEYPKLYARAHIGLNVHRDPGITAGCFAKRVKMRPSSMQVPAGITLSQHPPKSQGTGMANDGDYPAAHVNPRFFEMAACGSLVISDAFRPELRRMFPFAPQAEDPDHFLELVHYYLAHSMEAKEISQACSFLISKRHTYQHRAAEVLIRAGLTGSQVDKIATSLGEQADWLTPQDFNEQGVSLSSAQTGPSERWSPQSGRASMAMSGRVSEATSLDVQPPWLF